MFGIGVWYWNCLVYMKFPAVQLPFQVSLFCGGRLYFTGCGSGILKCINCTALRPSSAQTYTNAVCETLISVQVASGTFNIYSLTANNIHMLCRRRWARRAVQLT